MKEEIMEERIELSEFEIQRMNRILAYSNLSKQRMIALPFFALAAAFAFIVPIMKGFNIESVLLAIPFAMMALFIGMARLGYYKLFRIIQYLGQTPNNIGRD